MSSVYLNSLLNGPSVQILHDEKRDGSFNVISHGRPLSMLTYFSSTIRQQFPDEAYYRQQQWPQPYPVVHQPPQIAVRLVGGEARSIIDLIEWMTSCCRQNTILPLRSVVACPFRYILAMDGVQKLGIDLLAQDLPSLVSRLRYEIFDLKTVGKIFSAGGCVLPEITEAICHCIARYFFHGSLPEVGRWMSLARLNARFDQGVARWLAPGALNEGPDTLGAWGLWESKNPGAYPARWSHPPWSEPAPLHSYPPVISDWPGAEAQRSSNLPLPTSAHPSNRIDVLVGDWQGPSMPYPPPHLAPPPPPPPKPEAYLPRSSHYEPFSFVPEVFDAAGPHQAHDTWQPHLHYHRHAPPPPAPEYTVRCNFCQDVYPQSAAGAHQCMTSRVYTISDSPSPPQPYREPRRRSRSARRGRSLSQGDHFHRRRSSSMRRHWDPAHEPPRPGEYLRERRQVGPGHFLHFFVDEFGRERVVSKGDDIATEERPW